MSVEEIMKKYEIKASSTFYTIIKNEEKIKSAENREPNSKRIKLSSFPDVDKTMEIWFRDVNILRNPKKDGFRVWVWVKTQTQNPNPKTQIFLVKTQNPNPKTQIFWVKNPKP